jgi:hypothetical protein
MHVCYGGRKGSYIAFIALFVRVVEYSLSAKAMPKSLTDLYVKFFLSLSKRCGLFKQTYTKKRQYMWTHGGHTMHSVCKFVQDKLINYSGVV